MFDSTTNNEYNTGDEHNNDLAENTPQERGGEVSRVGDLCSSASSLHSFSVSNGWIKIHRKFTEWEWYTNPNTRIVFEHLVIMANHEDKKWRGFEVKRGERITSLANIAKETGLSVRNVRTAIKNLKSTGELTSEAHNQFSLIKIKNYDNYQGYDKPHDKRPTSDRQATDKRPTTNKNNKNYKNEKNDKNNSLDFSQIRKEFLDLFISYSEMRKKIKKPLTQNAISIYAKDFEKHSDEEIRTALSDSIKNSWQGIFFKEKKKIISVPTNLQYNQQQ